MADKKRKLRRPIKDYLPLLDPLVDKVLEAEKEEYHNDLVPFDQHSAQVKEQVHLGEKEYLERMQKAIKLLEKRFGKEDKLLFFIKV